jgi:hypothetical protein
VLYFSGFDAASQTGPIWHNTAWIYRAELPDETPQIQRTGANLTLPIDTAHGWQYQLRHLPDLSAFSLHLPPPSDPEAGRVRLSRMSLLCQPSRPFLIVLNPGGF